MFQANITDKSRVFIFSFVSVVDAVDFCRLAIRGQDVSMVTVTYLKYVHFRIIALP